MLTATWASSGHLTLGNRLPYPTRSLGGPGVWTNSKAIYDPFPRDVTGNVLMLPLAPARVGTGRSSRRTLFRPAGQPCEGLVRDKVGNRCEHDHHQACERHHVSGRVIESALEDVAEPDLLS